MLWEGMPMPSPEVRIPTQARAKRSRASLVTAAEREFEDRGYASTTARTIAERAGVAVGTFYQYFRDKDGVLHEIARCRAERMLAKTVAEFEAYSAASPQAKLPNRT